MRKINENLLFVFGIIITAVILFAFSTYGITNTIVSDYSTFQDTSKYNSYTRYLMFNQTNEVEQIIYVNIVDRTFSLNLDIDDFYDEVNYQSMCALSVVRLFLLDEGEANGEDSGKYMIIFRSAMEEGATYGINWEMSKQSQFDRHMDWGQVLQAYTLGSGVLRAKIELRKDFRKMNK